MSCSVVSCAASTHRLCLLMRLLFRHFLGCESITNKRPVMQVLHRAMRFSPVSSFVSAVLQASVFNRLFLQARKTQQQHLLHGSHRSSSTSACRKPANDSGAACVACQPSPGTATSSELTNRVLYMPAAGRLPLAAGRPPAGKLPSMPNSTTLISKAAAASNLQCRGILSLPMSQLQKQQLERCSGAAPAPFAAQAAPHAAHSCSQQDAESDTENTGAQAYVMVNMRIPAASAAGVAATWWKWSWSQAASQPCCKSASPEHCRLPTLRRAGAGFQQHVLQACRQPAPA